ncbi:MAG: hypothetical protein WC022_04380 [Parcubacteria group bacterium]
MKSRVSSLKNLLLIGVVLLVFAGCATVPPTGEQLKIASNLNGTTWEGEQFEEGGLWHVFGDKNTGATSASIRLVFLDNKVEYSTSGAPNPFWSAIQKTRGGAGTRIKDYVIENDGEIVFPSFRNDHKMVFRLEGDTLVGGRDDLGGLVWRLHRVTKKEIATTVESPVREEPKQEPPSDVGVSLPTIPSGFGSSLR